MLRKHISVWMVYVRSTIAPLIITLVLMAAVQTGSFLWAIQYSACSLENIVLAAYLQQSLLGGILLLTVLLCRIHGGGYTLRRLRISEHAVFLWHGFTNFSCFVLLWMAEVCITTALCSHFLAQSTNQLSNQTLFLGFYRSEFLHSILPLEEVSRWIYLLITFLSLAFVIADTVLRKQHGGSIRNNALLSLTVIATLWYLVRPLGSLVSDVLLCLLHLAFGLYALWDVWFHAEEEEDNEND